MVESVAMKLFKGKKQILDIELTKGYRLPTPTKSGSFKEMEIYQYLQMRSLEMFGKDTIVLYQFGDFFESYFWEESEEDMIRARSYSETMNFMMSGSKKDALYNNTVYESGPYMMGFPASSLEVNKGKLLNAGWNIVVIKQDGNQLSVEKTNTAKKTVRRIADIRSPSTGIDVITGETHTFCQVLMDYTEVSKTVSVGLAITQAALGVVIVRNKSGQRIDVIDSIRRIFLQYKPNEVVFTNMNQRMTLQDGLNMIGISSDYYRIQELPIQPEFTQMGKIIENQLCYLVDETPKRRSILEQSRILQKLGLHQDHTVSIGAMALGILVAKLLKESPKMLNNIQVKTEQNDTCMLYGNAIDQLSIFNKLSWNQRSGSLPSSRQIISSRWTSLYSMLNVCKTAGGARNLQYRLANPSVSVETIRGDHCKVEKLMDITDDINKTIDGTLDGERIIRRLEINDNITPSLVYNFYRWLKKVKLLHTRLSMDEMLCSGQTDEMIDELIQYVEDHFVIDILAVSEKSYWFQPLYEKSPFIKIQQEYMDNMNKRTQLIRDIVNNPSQEFEYNRKTGYSVKITSKARIALFNKWQKDDSITRKDPIISEFKSVHKSSLKSAIKLTSHEWDKAWFKRAELDSQIHEDNRVYLSEWTQRFYEKYGKTCYLLERWVTTIDVLNTFAYVSKKYGYYKPTILEDEKQTIIGSNLRHPMVERIVENDAGYVANDVNISPDKLGLLLYGVNASGKSVYMKSVGLAVVLSQAGCFVPCQNMKHSIFKRIFTRISGNDDYVRGKSSFALEMEELSMILKNSNEDSIVLGDEICRGTEQDSGSSLVTASIQRLLNSNVPFIFATHLHTIQEVSVIRSYLERGVLSAKHMRVLTGDDGSLIYDRKLLDGQGSLMYGIEVAKALGIPDDVIETAMAVRKELKGIKDVSSRYNSKVHMGMCQCCGLRPAVDTHHIQEQHDADERGIVGGSTRIHSGSNLVTICKDCHDRHHSKKEPFTIVGWVQKADGSRVLNVKKT